MRMLISGLIAVGGGVASYVLFGSDWLLSGWTTVVWFVGVYNLLKLWNNLLAAPLVRSGPLSSIMVGLVTGAGLLGVSPFLPLSADLRLAIQWLVIGTGTAMYSLGIVVALRRVSSEGQVGKPN